MEMIVCLQAKLSSLLYKMISSVFSSLNKTKCSEKLKTVQQEEHSAQKNSVYLELLLILSVTEDKNT